MKNKNLTKAKENKNDEFYTLYNDIEKELSNYKSFLVNKIVYLNCDNPKYSNFWKYFYENFHNLKLKELRATYLSSKTKGELYIFNGKKITINTLNENGSFDSQECISLLKTSDIIITNPPFSPFRNFIDLLISYDKKFIIIGPMTSFSYKKIFDLYKNNKINIGNNKIHAFLDLNGNIKKFGNIYWFQNITKPSLKNIKLTKIYDNSYIKFENYDALYIKNIKDIPIDYTQKMAVPLTFIEYQPINDYDVLGLSIGLCFDGNIIGKDIIHEYFSKGGKGHYSANMKGVFYRDNKGNIKFPFARIIIKKKKDN